MSANQASGFVTWRIAIGGLWVGGREGGTNQDGLEVAWLAISDYWRSSENTG